MIDHPQTDATEDRSPEAVDTFLEGVLLRPNPVLDTVAKASEKSGLVPHAVSPLQAEFLAMLVRLTGAKRIL
ncbi:MAG: hypothetical protein AAGG45_10805, partial [Pseudomonadota bacterium]